MIELIVQLRAMQLFTHHAHNMVGKVLFFQDHEFFGDTYPEFETDYDDVVERTIGKFGTESIPQLPALLAQISAKIAKAPSNPPDNRDFYVYLLNMELELCTLVDSLIKKGTSSGTEQLLGEICNKSEMRQYKIKQRLKKN